MITFMQVLEMDATSALSPGQYLVYILTVYKNLVSAIIITQQIQYVIKQSNFFPLTSHFQCLTKICDYHI